MRYMGNKDGNILGLFTYLKFAIVRKPKLFEESIKIPFGKKTGVMGICSRMIRSRGHF